MINREHPLSITRKAAKATCALNAGECVRRVRRADFLTIENSCRQSRRTGIMPRVSTYRAVQICAATSVCDIERETGITMGMFEG